MRLSNDETQEINSGARVAAVFVSRISDVISFSSA